MLKQQGKRGLYDLGNADSILPMAAGVRVQLRHKARYLSVLNAPHKAVRRHELFWVRTHGD